jgi:hypothetical protein
MSFRRWWQNVRQVVRVVPLVVGLAAFLMTGAVAAQEATPGVGQTCQDVIDLDVAAQTQRLLADCVTDEMISVATGWTFDGDGHTIYAVDPAAGRLQAAVLFVGEGVGNVHDVVIDGSGLEAPCLSDDGATVLGGIVFLGSTGEARRVTVRNLVRAFPTDQAQMTDGESQRKSCGTGIAIVGESTVTVASSTISDVGYVGILVEDSSATIASNIIVHAEDTGLLGLRGAQVDVLPGNQVRYGGVGIQFEGAGTGGNIDGSGVAHMKTAGIVSMADATVSLVDTTLEEIDGFGVVAVGGGAITAERVDVQRTDRAFVADGGSLQIQEATIAECLFGVLSMNGGSSEVSDSTVRACDIGLGAGGPGSRLSSSKSTITGSDRAGVMLDGGAEAALHELRITQSGAGIAATDHNLVDLVDLHIQDTIQVGVLASGGSQVTMTSSGMRNPGEYGVIVDDAGTLLVSSENSITDAEQAGFQVLDGARLETSNTRIYGGDTGIAIEGSGATAQLTGSYISDTGTNLLVTDGAQVDAVQLFTAGGATGVVISGEGSRATVQESTIQRASQDGVRVQAGGWVSVETSTITDAAGSAISLERGADLPTAVELVMDESGCTPRVVTLPAGVRTEITFRNTGQHQGRIESNVGVAFDLAPGDTEMIGLTSAPADTALKCILPGGSGAWEEVIFRAIPPDETPLLAAPANPLVLRANVIQGGSQGIVIGDGISAIVTENMIEGVTGEALVIAEGAIVESQNNEIVAATPSSRDAD